jgi:hypothetical protein
MRPEILIARLETVALAFPAAAGLAVAFPNFVQFIRAGESGKLERLCELLRQGGEPVGFVFARREGCELQLGAAPLAELDNHSEISRDLETILQYWQSLLTLDGRVAAVPVE